MTDFYSFVSATRDQTRACDVERGAEHARFGFKRAWLWDVLHVLERSARVVVPKRHRTIVAYVYVSISFLSDPSWDKRHAKRTDLLRRIHLQR
jgi:hypothetical protein